MAVVKVKKKKVPSANLPSQMDQAPMIGANIMGAQPVPSANVMGAQPVPSATTGPIGGAVPSANVMGAQPVPRAEGMSQQIDVMEMRSQGAPAASPVAVPAQKPMPKAKVKTRKQKDPPGTFRTSEGTLVIGDMKKFQAWKSKK